MLSIGKLGAGQQQYYLQAVADGAEDYYVLAGEAPGTWAGGGRAALGLDGRVDGRDFTTLLQLRDPRSGDPLGRAPSRRVVPGFDLTFSAPKSVSVLWALGDSSLADLLQAAHDRAVNDALGYLERTASHGRRGHGGALRMPTDGFVAAVFRHRTSRAGDPHLHSHAVVVNRVYGRDGAWSALDARALYVQAKTAGTLYQASLRHGLRELGLSWTVAPTGLGELDAVPPDVRRAFSQRRQQVEAALTDRGLTSARAAQVATLQTRAAKDHSVDPDGLRGAWRSRAADLGFDAVRLREALQSRGVVRDEYSVPDVTALLGPRGLTAHASTFGERDVLRAVANALPAGAPVGVVERMAELVLADPSVLPLAGPAGPSSPPHPGQRAVRPAVPVGAAERRYSTVEMMTLEQSVVDVAVAAAPSGPVADAAHVDQALAERPRLSAEQSAMVRALALSGERVQVVNAAAGAGKTTALDAIVQALRASGVPVVGTTLSAKAAGVLRDATGLPTFTTAQLLLDLADPRTGGLPHGGVLVVDEAGQVGTRTLAVLLEAVVASQGRLVLVGDAHQLPEIDAGGAFRGLLSRLETIELSANHRQVDEDERARLAELRRGDVQAAVTSYDDAGRITRADSGEALRAALVRDWLAAWTTAAEEGRSDIVMLGLTNADVDDLNDRAQESLIEAGVLVGPSLVLGARRYVVGDHVVTRRNDRSLGVLNGDRWRVAAVDDATGALQLAPVGRLGRVVTLPSSYVLAHHGRLQHAYALTTAVSQGSSVDRAYVLGSDATYREAGYTAASRARLSTQFYVVASEPDQVAEEFPGRVQVVDDVDPLTAFAQALGRSRAQDLALDTTSVADPAYAVPTTEELVRARGLLRAQLADAPRDQRRTLVRLQAELETADQRLTVAEQAGREDVALRWSGRRLEVAAQMRATEELQRAWLSWEAEHAPELRRLADLDEAVRAVTAIDTGRERDTA